LIRARRHRRPTHQIGGRHVSHDAVGGAVRDRPRPSGSTISPTMAAAYRACRRRAAPHATSTINVVLRVAGSLGTAAARDLSAAPDRRQHPEARQRPARRSAKLTAAQRRRRTRRPSQTAFRHELLGSRSHSLALAVPAALFLPAAQPGTRERRMIVAPTYQWLVLAHLLAPVPWLGGPRADGRARRCASLSKPGSHNRRLPRHAAFGRPVAVFAPMPVILLGPPASAWSPTPTPGRFDQGWVQIRDRLFVAVFGIGAPPGPATP